MNTTKIGWIGLGKIGVPMAMQLIKAGYSVTVYNRDHSKEAQLIALGASNAATPAEILKNSDTIILMISDDNATREIFTGENGLLKAAAKDKIIINMSTVSPAISKEMATLCAKAGAVYLDAPVSGSVKQATDGQLVIMVGGELAAFEKVKPVFEAMGKMALHLGPVGAGNASKLAINSLLAIYAQGLAETVVFANACGVATTDLLTLLNNGALGNAFTKIKGDAIIHENYEAAFALKHIVKDISLAKGEGLNAALSEVTLKTFTEAATAHAEEDIIAVIKSLRASAPPR